MVFIIVIFNIFDIETNRIRINDNIASIFYNIDEKCSNYVVYISVFYKLNRK
jgi:hypothetical protein